MRPAPHRPDSIRALIRRECRKEGGRLLAAAISAALVGACSVLLLGLSGWFIAATALTGGAAAAAAFNALLPSATIRLLAILRTGGRYGERVFGHDAVLRAFSRIRPALFSRLAAGAPETALAMPEGDAVSRLVNDLDELEHQAVIRHTASWSWLATLAAGFALLLPFGGWNVTAAVAVLVAGLHALARMLDRHARQHENGLAAARAALRDVLSLLCDAGAELRTYALQDWIVSRIGALSLTQAGAERRIARIAGWMALARVSASGIAGMIAVAAILGTAHDGAWGIERAALCALAASMVVEGAASRLQGAQRWGEARETERRLDAMARTHAPGRSTGGRPTGAPTLDWRDGTMPTPPGTIVALLGPSGSGKTTLLHRMTGLLTPPCGCMAIGGCDLAALDPADARRCFALMPQDAPLLIGTIRENLTLMRPCATEAEMWDALHVAALDERIRRMPHGLETWLAADAALSGGERRRLALARTLLSDAPWLLLDEPTESLDAATEMLILQRLPERLRRRRQGALIVTHRTAPLAICDEIHALSPIPKPPVDAVCPAKQ
ncbi:ATP-binding cassette domain-containing protein [Acetobacteraceae bacterium KSS8]|uniref:ATP-binding cassette domain-containing protein n=1 Tax=Endosaccharibacter trunci TaxID=2812733 RepID=A0ABT1W7K6_9PROT|nr:ATP-binding cassette domain-containing protein [Acetobacteraceae bacterium KSS8]